MPLSRNERTRMERHLTDLWTRLDVPPMPANEVKRLTDRDLPYLLRFWSHKARHWVTIAADDVDGSYPPELVRQPDFAEEPPRGYADMAAEVFVAADTGAIPPANFTAPSRNFGRQFKGSGGGQITARQGHKVQRS